MYAVLLLGKQCRINNSESESESEVYGRTYLKVGSDILIVVFELFAVRRALLGTHLC